MALHVLALLTHSAIAADPSSRARELVRNMTLEEKVQLLTDTAGK